MSRLLLSCGVLAALLVSGCGSRSDESKSADNAAYEKSIEQKLADYDARIDSLKVRVDAAGDSAKTEAREDMAALEVEREKAKAKLEELRTSGAEYWDRTKLALVAELDTLDQKFDRAREHMR